MATIKFFTDNGMPCRQAGSGNIITILTVQHMYASHGRILFRYNYSDGDFLEGDTLQINGFTISGTLEEKAQALRNYFKDFFVNAPGNGGSSGKLPLTGYSDSVIQINGINCRLVTSNGYDYNGDPDTLLIICHGNNSSYSAQQPSEAAKNLFRTNNISWSVIQAQDFTTTPNIGWGNQGAMNRIVMQYDYLMRNYNFKIEIVIAGVSMGGLVMGQLMHNRKIPIRFAIGIGPVPSLKYIWDNGVSTRKPAIRLAYGLAEDGSEDDSIDAVISGRDWYSKNVAEIDEVRTMFMQTPLYCVWGNSDTAFNTEFGGDAVCGALINGINSGGGLATYGEINAPHAHNDVWDAQISNGVFERELGIVNTTPEPEPEPEPEGDLIEDFETTNRFGNGSIAAFTRSTSAKKYGAYSLYKTSAAEFKMIWDENIPVTKDSGKIYSMWIMTATGYVTSGFPGFSFATGVSDTEGFQLMVDVRTTYSLLWIRSGFVTPNQETGSLNGNAISANTWYRLEMELSGGNLIGRLYDSSNALIDTVARSLPYTNGYLGICGYSNCYLDNIEEL